MHFFPAAQAEGIVVDGLNIFGRKGWRVVAHNYAFGDHFILEREYDCGQQKAQQVAQDLYGRGIRHEARHQETEAEGWGGPAD
jgi:hypothetical protein